MLQVEENKKRRKFSFRFENAVLSPKNLIIESSGDCLGEGGNRDHLNVEVRNLLIVPSVDPPSILPWWLRARQSCFVPSSDMEMRCFLSKELDNFNFYYRAGFTPQVMVMSFKEPPDVCLNF
jgi:hypothetical protein